MKMVTSFEVGDPCWYIVDHEKMEIRCTACAGNGSLMVDCADGRRARVPCPFCNGEGTVEIGRWSLLSEDPATIEKITIILDDRGIAELLEATIGGPLLKLGPAHRAFSNKAEAQEECDRRNKELLEEVVYGHKD